MTIPPFDPELLLAGVAKAMFTAADPENADAEWEALEPSERDDMIEMARVGIQHFTQAASDLGARFLPPGVLPMPKSDGEANAMIFAGQQYLEAKRRKPGLVGSVAPKLIVPGGRLQ